tara:strand:- start:76563 stop:77996 length:1434 start_codon:yes stop_codon:yes gene_type:complete
MISHYYGILVSLFLILIYVLSIIYAIKAIMTVRTSQGTIAWVVSLLTFPFVALPLFWLFGRRKFHGYADSMRKAYDELEGAVQVAYDSILQHEQNVTQLHPLATTVKKLTHIGFTNSNNMELLIDGEKTYQSMFDALDAAQTYILFQFFIIHADEAGQAFQKRLIQKAKTGVSVYFLYDEIGCHSLPNSFISQMTAAGVQVSSFHTRKGKGNRFQVNFRNHRKIVIVDGKTAFIGGLNVGDEYLGKNKKFGHWRDTHLRLQGPSVQDIQLSFLRDWYWAQHTIPKVEWRTNATEQNQSVAIMSTGPDSPMETGALFILDMINMAHDRLWIASPYFVPDDTIIKALQLAVLRGVDVRIMLPAKADHMLVYLCSYDYYCDMQVAGVKLYRYEKGFMHQKVMLVDDRVASVGTVNLDNRSLYINFEITALSADKTFIQQVESMLNEDLTNCCTVDLESFARRPYLFRLMVKAIRLLAPIL